MAKDSEDRYYSMHDIVLDLRTSLYRHLQSLSLDFFVNRRVGEIISRHLGTKELNAVFPGFDNDPRKFPNLLKA